MQTKQQGFTLIELIVVIVILGILAATALPKFVDLGGDARVGVMRGVEGSMRAANTMIYAKSAAAGTATTATASVKVNGTTVNTVFGFAASWTELKKTMDLSPSTDFTDVDPGTSDNGGVRHTGAAAANQSTCTITYTAPAGSGMSPTYAVPATWNCA